MDKQPGNEKQPKNNKPSKDVVVLGEATDLTKGYDFEGVYDPKTYDKYNPDA